jgi:TRAP-type C4-dicarboxylate transport system permease small subunit
MSTLNKNKHTKPKHAIAVIALILTIGIGILSLSISTIMIHAQTSSDGISGSWTGVTQMRICVVGVKSPCNEAIN